MGKRETGVMGIGGEVWSCQLLGVFRLVAGCH